MNTYSFPIREKALFRVALFVLAILISWSSFGQPPSVQASEIAVTDLTSESIDISWLGGNGQGVYVVMTTNLTAPLPSMTGSYTANSLYGAGDLVGTDWFVVYGGDLDNVTVTGLASGTPYQIFVNEWDFPADFYNGGSTNNPVIHTTQSAGLNTDATLSSLSFDLGTLTPAFDPNTFNYTIVFPEGTTDINVAATTNDPNATLSGTGQYNVSGGPSFLEVIVTAEDGVTQRYYMIDYSVAVPAPTLMHSYTFDDGTALDGVGGANGTVFGGLIQNGVYTTSNQGEYIELPAASIGISGYSAVTLETYIVAGSGENTVYNMLLFYGRITAGDQGADYLATSVSTPDNFSYSSISTGVEFNAWENGEAVNGPRLEDGKKHHIVTILTSNSLSFYIDGENMGSITLNQNSITNISNEVAYLAKSGYGNDGTWIGSIDEFNIYEGVLDDVTINDNANAYLYAIDDATLATLDVDLGQISPAFDPGITSYTLTLNAGTFEVNVYAVPNNPSSTFSGVGLIDVSAGSGVIEIFVEAPDRLSTLTYSINYAVAPITINAPNSRESLVVGSTYGITWTDTFDAADAVEIRLVNDVLSTSEIIASGVADDFAGSYNWLVPNSVGDNYQIEVVNTTLGVSDRSDIPFKIVSTAFAPFITTWSTWDGQLTIPTNLSYTYNYEVSWANLTSPGRGDGYMTNQTGDVLITGLNNSDVYSVSISGDFPAINIGSFSFSGEEFKLQSIEQWGDISWQTMASAFRGAMPTINASDAPDLSLVTDMSHMFARDVGSDQQKFADLTNWDVSNVTNMEGVFYRSYLSTDVSTWQVSNVTNMTSMFEGNNFYGDVSGWDVSSVTYMYGMFNGAYAFDSPIGSWDVSSVENFQNMLANCSSFNQDLGGWDISAALNMQDMFNYAGLSLTNYDNTIIGWASLDAGETMIPSNIQLGAQSLWYSGASAAARNELINTYNWNITGDNETAPIVYYPNYQEFLFSDNLVGIQWENSFNNPADTIVVSWSADGGNTYSLITQGQAQNYNGYFEWTVPFASGNANFIRVENTTQGTSDVSDFAFVITNSEDASLNELYLENAQLTPAFDREIISYDAQLPFNATSTYVYASPTNGNAIVTGVGFVDVSAGSAVATIVVTAEDGVTTRSYSVNLQVSPMELYGFYEGQYIQANTTYGISWNHNFAGTDGIEILWSADGGSTFNLLASGIFDDFGGYFDWTIPDQSGHENILVINNTTQGKTVNSGKFKIVGSAALRHSYTFEDGTAADVLSGASGTVVGGNIANGGYTTSTNGDYIELPGFDIAINNYGAISLEAYVIAGSGENTGYTMLSYFGRTTASNLGADYLFTSVSRTDGISRAAISTGNETEPWNVEVGTNGPQLEDGKHHHVVTILTTNSISLYVDGANFGSATGDNYINAISPELAYLAKGGYAADPTWIGTIDEFNIYEGILSEQTILANAETYSDSVALGVTSVAINGSAVRSGNTEYMLFDKTAGSPQSLNMVTYLDPGTFTFIVNGSLNFGDNNADTFLEENGTALEIFESGLYHIRFDKTYLQYFLDKIDNIGFLGSARTGSDADGWNDPDTKMTDLGNGTFRLSNISLYDGQWKIRANDSWNVNWGINYNDGSLQYFGSNFGISAGVYNITVDLLSWNYYIEPVITYIEDFDNYAGDLNIPVTGDFFFSNMTVSLNNTTVTNADPYVLGGVGNALLLSSPTDYFTTQTLYNVGNISLWYRAYDQSCCDGVVFDVQVSTDGGSTFSTIGQGSTFDINYQEFTYDFPSAITGQIRVIYNGAGDRPLLIDNIGYREGMVVPSINIISPSGGEQIEQNSNFIVSWEQLNFDGDYLLAIDLSSDGGNNWFTINEDWASSYGGQASVFIDGNDPNLAIGSGYMVRVRESGGAFFDVAEGSFDIIAAGAPSITILSPLAGESYQQNTELIMSFVTTGLSADEQLDFQFSSDGGATWLNMGIEFVGAIAGKKYFFLQSDYFPVGTNSVLSIENSTSGIRVESEPFEITEAAPNEVFVTYPNGPGEQIQQSSIIGLSYSQNFWERDAIVKLEISTDAGVSFDLLDSGTMEKFQNRYSWHLDEAVYPTGSEYLIRVSIGNLSDVSDNTFEVVPSDGNPFLYVESYTDHTFRTGDVVPVRFYSNAITRERLLDIEYSNDGGLTYNLIVEDSIKNLKGYWEWPVDASVIPGNNYKLRVRTKDNLIISETEGTFSIISAPQISITTIPVSSTISTGDKDALIYKYSAEVSVESTITEGIVLQLVGDFLTTDFESFELFRSINVDAGQAAATSLGIGEFPPTSMTGFPPNSVLWIFEETYNPGDIIYYYVTANLSKNARAGSSFNIVKPEPDGNFGYKTTSANNYANVIDNGIAAGEIFTLEQGSYNPFITTWRTTTADETIIIPTNGEGYDYSVDWGDGQTDVGITGDASHTYATAGIYTVSIKGFFPRIFFAYGNNGQQIDKILTIEQWGDIEWSTTEIAFAGCTNLMVNATDAPDLRKVFSVGSMFNNCISLNADFNHWDVSNVQYFGGMFYQASSFDSPLGNWDIARAFDMNSMLDGANLSIVNYNSTLAGWADDNGGTQTIPSNIVFGAAGLEYNDAGETARNTLINSYNWTFSGDRYENLTTADFLSFSLADQLAEAFIDIDNNTVTIEIDPTVAASALVADFTISNGATINIGGVEQVSGSSTVDFSGVVTYTIIAADGVYSETWDVIVIQRAYFEGFTIAGQSGETVISYATKQIDITMPSGTDVTQLVPQFLSGADNQVLSSGVNPDGTLGGGYVTKEGVYYRLGVLTADISSWPETTYITDLGLGLYRVNEYIGLFAGNTWYFNVADNIISYPANTPLGAAQLLNNQPIITCELNPESMLNVPCDIESNFVTYPDSAMLTMSIGYFTAGSGAREFYQVMKLKPNEMQQTSGKSVVDFSAPVEYIIRSSTDAVVWTVNVTEEILPPNLTGQVNHEVVENSNFIATYTADQEVTWELFGLDKDFFNISDQGELSFIDVPDFENPLDLNGDNVYAVTIYATNAAGLSSTFGGIITVTDVNDNAPVYEGQTSVTFPENSPVGTVVTTLIATDADSNPTLTWTLLDAGFDLDLDLNPPFVLNETTGELTVNDADDLDFEGLFTEFDLSFEVSDGTFSVLGNVKVILEDVSEGITLTINPLGLINERAPEMSGTIDDPNASITITVGEFQFFPVNAGNGTWLLAKDSYLGLPDGEYEIYVSAENGSSNGAIYASLIIDATAPTVTVNSLRTNDPTPQLSGTIDDPEAFVTVTIDGVTYDADNQGTTWILADDATRELKEGFYDIQVSAVDAAGNIGIDLTTNELEIFQLSSNAFLQNLLVNELTISGFSQTKLNYSVVLPYGTTQIPTVTYLVSDPTSSVIQKNALELPGTSTVAVTAADGITRKVYRIAFTVAKNDDATIASLNINGTALKGFDPATLEYDIALPYGTINIPEINFELSDKNAKSVISDAETLPGVTIINTTSEDDKVRLIYTFNFTVTELSDILLVGTIDNQADIAVRDSLTKWGYTVNLINSADYADEYHRNYRMVYLSGSMPAANAAHYANRAFSIPGFIANPEVLAVPEIKLGASSSTAKTAVLENMEILTDLHPIVNEIYTKGQQVKVYDNTRIDQIAQDVYQYEFDLSSISTVEFTALGMPVSSTLPEPWSGNPSWAIISKRSQNGNGVKLGAEIVVHAFDAATALKGTSDYWTQVRQSVKYLLKEINPLTRDYTAKTFNSGFAPVIDGSPDRIWNSAPKVPINQIPEVNGEYHSNITVPNPTATDFSAEWSMVWGTDGLYVLVQVVDDNLVIEDDFNTTNATPADQWWTDDHITLLFSSDLVNTSFKKWEFAYQPTINQEENLSSSNWDAPAVIDGSLVQTAWATNGNTYTLETFIAWDAFADYTGDITPEMDIRVEMRAYDDDNTGSWESMYQWSSINYNVETDGNGLGYVTLSNDKINVGRELDSLALVKIYQSTKGASWTRKRNWLKGTLDTWYGVTLDPQAPTGTKRVISLNLPDNNLADSLPSAIADLSELRYLNLSGNKLIGGVSKNLASLNKLTYLNLSKNQMVRTIPANLSLLTNLGTLDLSYNGLSGLIPSVIGSMTNLTSLSLNNNKLEGKIPVSFASLGKIETLKLGNNRLFGEIPEIIGGLTTLKTLELHENDFIGFIPDELSTLVNLQVLKLSNNQLEGVIPAGLMKISTLSVFNINDNLLTGELSDDLGNLTKLTELQIQNNSFFGEIPASLSNLTSLRIINVSNNAFTGSLSPISQILTLRYIDISHNMFTELTDLTKTPVDTILAYNNWLDFGDFDLNKDLIRSERLFYMPQDSLYDYTDSLHTVGDMLTISFDIGGYANSYQWYLNGTPLSSSTDNNVQVSQNEIIIVSPDSPNEGEYVLEITNEDYPELTLVTRPFNLKITSLERDKKALLEFIAAVDKSTNPHRYNPQNWSAANPLNSSWEGVTVENNRVTAINLPAIINTEGTSRILDGRIPSSFADLSGLVTVSLQDNYLRSLPNISKWPSVQTVNVNNNRLDFDALVPNMSLGAKIIYQEQRRIGFTEFDTLVAGEDPILAIPSQGIGAQYQWKFGKYIPGQFYNDNVTNIPSANSRVYQIENLDYDKMGTYRVVATHPKVPGLSIESRNKNIMAATNMYGTVYANEQGSTISGGQVLTFRKTPKGPFVPEDTVEISSSGEYFFENIVLGDFIVLTKPDRELFPNQGSPGAFVIIDTYYGGVDSYDQASTLELRQKMESINTQMLSYRVPEAPPTGADFNGLLESLIEGPEYEDEEGTARILARKKVKRAACSMRRYVASGRIKQDSVFVLYAYVESDDDGKFSFTNIEEGVYKLNIEYPGVPMNPDAEITFIVGGDKENQVFNIEATITDTGIGVISNEILYSIKPYVKDIILYPNPTQGRLTMDFLVYRKVNDLKLEVVDARGVKLFEQELSSRLGYQQTTVDLTAYTSGLYYIVFTDKVGSFRHLAKVTKQK